jgi:hypothetical protein
VTAHPISDHAQPKVIVDSETVFVG